MSKASRKKRQDDEASEEEEKMIKHEEKLEAAAQTDAKFHEREGYIFLEDPEEEEEQKEMGKDKEEDGKKDEKSEEKYLESLRSGSCVGILSKLSHKQRILLKDSFQAMEEESTRNGLSVFIKLFQDYPNYKKLFPKFLAVADSALIGSTDLRSHASIYMSGLRQIIHCIDEEKALYTELKKIAMTHQRKGIRKFHILHMLPMVLGTLKCCMDILTPEIEEAWTSLFEVISSLVEELQQQERNKAQLLKP